MFGSETEAVIYGRPDLEGNPDFGMTQAKAFPPYVFSVHGCAGLIHKVARVDLRWWSPSRSENGARLLKRRHPIMIARTVCNQTKFLEGARSRTCRVPEPDALLCGVCHGEPATFGKHGKATLEGIPRRVAHVKLGCVVKGY